MKFNDDGIGDGNHEVAISRIAFNVATTIRGEAHTHRKGRFRVYYDFEQIQHNYIHIFRGEMRHRHGTIWLTFYIHILRQHNFQSVLLIAIHFCHFSSTYPYNDTFYYI